MVVAIVLTVVGASIGALLATVALNLGYEMVKSASQRKGKIRRFWVQLFGDRVVETGASEEKALPQEVPSSRAELKDELGPKMGLPLTPVWREGQYYPQGQQVFAMSLEALPRPLMEAALPISERGGRAQPTPPGMSFPSYDSHSILTEQRH